MQLIPLAPPSMEPLSLDETKAFLRVSTAEEDAIVGSAIAAARLHLEQSLRVALIDQSWTYRISSGSCVSAVTLPIIPFKNVDAVRYDDGTGAASVVSTDSYSVDVQYEAGRILFQEPQALATDGQASGPRIEIDFSCGYGPQRTDVPETLRRALLLITAHFFETRDVHGSGAGNGSDHLLSRPDIAALIADIRPFQL